MTPHNWKGAVPAHAADDPSFERFGGRLNRENNPPSGAEQCVLGVDLGLTGAIALLNASGALLAVHDMPTLRDGAKGRATVNGPLLAEILAKMHATTAFVEYVGPRPGEGAASGFSFGRTKGLIEGACAALDIPVRFLTAPTWKRIIGIAPGASGAKDAARSEAVRRWPAQAHLFARVKDDGRAEAALIGVAGLLRERAR